jgi:hypothetical protein
MAIGGHWSVVAALCCQQATAERGRAIANYLTDLVKAAESTRSLPGPLAFKGCRGIHEARRRSRPCGSFSVKHYPIHLVL